MELRPDVVIAGKLRLLRVLGQGGMGVVWAARHLTLGTDVAVKVIRPERIAADPSLLARFEREARATARIAHPHVVTIMDYGMVDAAIPFIVMELLPGFSLADLLERGGRFSVATAVTLVDQVGAALAAAHEHGIVHRDVKPHNLFITEGSRDRPLHVKVLDFGVAKLLADADGLATAVALTETGVVIGSAPYMSPEQLEGRKDVDHRADLWSLGVIVYEVLTGTLPFHGGSFVTVGAAVLEGKYRPASELQPSLPAALDDWLARALCLAPAGRFQSAREMADAFRKLGVRDVSALATDDSRARTTPTESTATASHEPVASPPRPKAPRRLWRRALVGSIVCLVIALGAGELAWTHRGPSACPPGMALIPGARFEMGSASEGDTPSDETTPAGVANLASVRAFCLDTTEVTVKAFLECTTCEHAARTADFEGLTPNGRAFESQFCNGPDAASHPVNCVDWNQAASYCASVGKRLPSEAEWERSARGEKQRSYAWGEDPPSAERLNACGIECSRLLTTRLESLASTTKVAAPSTWPTMYPEDDSAAATAPVGHYPAGASPEGVMDLAGNVWEWTASPYCPYPFEEGRECGDSRRVLRGGGWDTTDTQSVRAARRYPSAPSARGKSIGFRCAKSL